MTLRDINEKPTTKQVFFWNMAGSVANSFLSVVTLMIVTRMLTTLETDIFSLGWSISQMMATIGTFQVRMYQATDVRGVFRFGQYLEFRIFTLLIMIISSAGYVITKGYDSYKALIIIILCRFRAVEALADVYEGYFQQKERLDLAGKAVTYRVLITLLLFVISLLFFHNLFISSIALLLGFTVSFLVFNIRYSLTVKTFDIRAKWNRGTYWVIKLVREVTPLFVNSFLMMMIINAPKLQIDETISSGILKDGAQTVFSILFMPASVLTLIYIVFRPLLTKMAIEWNDGRRKQFLQIIFMMLGGLFAMSIVVLLAAWVLGIPVLSILYGIELGNCKTELIILIIGGFLYTFSNVFDNALIVMRKQYLLLISYLLSWIFVKLTVNALVSSMGLIGAAISYTLSMGVFCFINMLIFFVSYEKLRSKETQ